MSTERNILGTVVILAVLLTVLVVVSSGCVHAAAPQYVNPGESIQNAVDLADPGDTIIVRDGTYTGNITVYKRLTIHSENGAQVTTVQAAGEHVFKLTADRVNITGFTIMGDANHCGVHLKDVNNCTIANNIILDNYQGMYLSNANNNSIHNNTAKNNTNNGIYLYASTNNRINHNNASYNLNYYGISLSSSNQNEIRDNIALANHLHGIKLLTAHNNTIVNNTANKNSNNGMYLDSSSNNRIVANNASYNVKYHGIVVSTSDHNDIRDNIALGNHLNGIGLWTAQNNTIVKNTANNNGNSGIYIDTSSYNTIRNNNAAHNVKYHGIFLVSSDQNELRNNRALGNHVQGIKLSAAQNNTMVNNTVENNSDCGIYLDSSSNNTLTANSASNNANYGIRLNTSCYNTLADNTANLNTIYGIYLSYSSNNNTLTGNTANANNDGGIYLYSSCGNNLTGNTAANNSNYGMLLGYSSNNNTLADNIANANNEDGLYLYLSRDNALIGNIASYNEVGIRLWYAHHNTLTDNTANANNYCGIILFYWCNNNTLTNNTASDNLDYGIRLRSSNNNNTLRGNIASNNSNYGIHLHASSNNTLSDNADSNNSNCGMYLSSSNDNHIYNNYFENTNNAYDDGINIWNSTPSQGTNIIGGSWLGGNYWSDYAGRDWTGDGLGDTLRPYNASGNITTGGDWHPLVKDPFTNLDVGVTTNITITDPQVIAAYLPSEYDGMDISDAVVLTVTVTDDTPGNPADPAYTDIIINVGGLNIETCRVFKTDFGFLPEVPDLSTLSTVDGYPAFSRDTANNTVTIRLYVGDPLLAVVPLALPCVHNLDTGKHFTTIQAAINDQDTEDGQVILVDSGIYQERVTVTKQLMVHGNDTGAGKPVVDAGGTGSAITLAHDDSVLDGLSVTNASGDMQAGIFVYSQNNYIINCSASNNANGIWLDASYNNTLTRNIAANNTYGIRLNASCYNTILDNTASNNSFAGISLAASSSSNYLTDNIANSNKYYGILLSSSDSNNLTGNIANSNNYTGMYLYASSTNTLTSNTASNNTLIGIYFEYSSNNNTITSNTASNNDYGIYLHDDSSNNTITGNTANANNVYGIKIDSSCDSVISNNIVTNNHVGGIDLADARKNTVTNNSVNNNTNVGIYLWSVTHNVTDNIVSNNIVSDHTNSGISLQHAYNNRITGNRVKNAKNVGIALHHSSSNNTITANTVSTSNYSLLIDLYSGGNNTIFFNNFINNTNRASDDTSTNYWDYGYPSGGNYWSDYNGSDCFRGPYQDLPGSDGIGDTPYTLLGNGGAQDRYPFMNENGWLSLFTKTDVGVTSTITIANPTELAVYLPPECDGIDFGDAVVLTVNITDNTNSTTDDAYTDLTINVGDMDIQTCKVFKSDMGFLPEVPDLIARPTVDGDPAFSRDLGNNTVTIRLYVGDPLLAVLPPAEPPIFDTGKGGYPSISGTFTGTITPSQNLTVSTLYTYSCNGTGGHTRSIALYDGTTPIASGVWSGYAGNWHNIIFNEVTLVQGHEYRYVILTGSYPQIIHAESKNVTGGRITCELFVDHNNAQHQGWIPAIRLQ